MISFPDKKYNIIYADPPWSYQNNHWKYASNKHYKIMTNSEIYNLPVQNITDDNCLLFLWCTFPKLKEGIKTLESWGFTYKTCGFCWLKTAPKKVEGEPYICYVGIGYYTRQNCEVCLIGTKGKGHRFVDVHLKPPITSGHIEPRSKHSKKPDAIRDKISRLCPTVTNKIELFARQKTEGWDVWGNEV